MQSEIALSATDSEYLAISSAMREVLPIFEFCKINHPSCIAVYLKKKAVLWRLQREPIPHYFDHGQNI
jgi:hypothetical protein